MTSRSINLRALRGLRHLLAAGAIAAFVVAGCSDSTADDVEAGIDEATDQVSEAVDGAEVDDAAAEIDARSAELAQTLRDNGMTSLASAVEEADISEVVGDGEFTLFAPSDEAFLALGADETADLLSDPSQLNAVLADHVVTDKIDSSALGGMTVVETRGGASLDVVVDGDTITVGDATVVTADIDVADGVVHVIDTVIMP